MKLSLTAAAAALALLAAPAAASAATLTISPEKSCFRSGETVTLLGSGFTPNSSVNVTRSGTSLGPLGTDVSGNFNGTLRLGRMKGSGRITYVATDAANPALTATTPLVVSAVNVLLRPTRDFPPNVRFRIRATGFTTGSTLWAHVVLGRSVRNVRVGRLKGACNKLETRRRLLPRGAASGVYTLHFDTFRRYRESRQVRDGYTLSVTRTFGPSAARFATVSSLL